MPELPEVETIRQGLLPHLLQHQIISVIVRNIHLRWPIEPSLQTLLLGKTFLNITRRGKYLLFHLNQGTLIIHLGMSGKLCLIPKNQPEKKHDHVDFNLENNLCLRYTDPRRFGSIFYIQTDPLDHPLLRHLGIEPLDEQFNGEYLFQHSRNKKVPVKLFIMNSKIVTGVGNIYANEALFAAHLHPKKSAGKISLQEYILLAKSIKEVLNKAIKAGGTTLRDFLNSDGNPGYFVQQLKVYDRGNKNCIDCNNKLIEIRLGQRQTVFCEVCQPLNKTKN